MSLPDRLIQMVSLSDLTGTHQITFRGALYDVTKQADGSVSGSLSSGTGLPVHAAPGVGTHLQALLARLGITHTSGCGCKGMAQKMDRNPPQWSRDHEDEILAVMAAEAKSRGLPWVEFVARQLIRSAVRRAEQDQAHLPT